MSQNSELRVPYGLSVHGEEEIEAVIEVLEQLPRCQKMSLLLKERSLNFFPWITV